MQRVTKKEAAKQLVQMGFKEYITEMVRQHVKTEVALDEQEKNNYPDRFVRLFRQYAKSHGIDIKKFL